MAKLVYGGNPAKIEAKAALEADRAATRQLIAKLTRQRNRLLALSVIIFIALIGALLHG